jgi:hypothetical protein
LRRARRRACRHLSAARAAAFQGRTQAALQPQRTRCRRIGGAILRGAGIDIAPFATRAFRLKPLRDEKSIFEDIEKLKGQVDRDRK